MRQIVSGQNDLEVAKRALLLVRLQTMRHDGSKYPLGRNTHKYCNGVLLENSSLQPISSEWRRKFFSTILGIATCTPLLDRYQMFIQLNMYNFHKISTQGNTMAFKNDIFWYGNQPNFHQIQRKKRHRDQEKISKQFSLKYKAQLKTLHDKAGLLPKQKNLLSGLLEYKFVATENAKLIKKDLQQIYKVLKDSRSKKIGETLTSIKQKYIQELQEAIQISEKIDKNFRQKLNQKNQGEFVSIMTPYNLNQQNIFRIPSNEGHMGHYFSSMNPRQTGERMVQYVEYPMRNMMGQSIDIIPNMEKNIVPQNKNEDSISEDECSFVNDTMKHVKQYENSVQQF